MDTLRRLFEGDPSSKMNIDLDAEDSRGSGDSAPAARTRRKGIGRPPRRHGGLQRDTPATPTPSSPAAMGMVETGDIAEEWLEPAAEEATAPLRDRKERDSHPPTGVGRAPSANPRSAHPDRLTWTPKTTWNSATPTQPLDCLDPLGVNPLEDPMAEAHVVDHPEEEPREDEDPLEEDPLMEGHLEDPLDPRWTPGSEHP